MRKPAWFCTSACAAPPKPPRDTHAATADKIYTGDEVKFMKAIKAFKKREKVLFPTRSPVLKVLRELGCRKG